MRLRSFVILGALAACGDSQGSLGAGGSGAENTTGIGAGGSSITTTSGATTAGTGGAGGGVSPPDPCASAVPVCDTVAPAVAGGGLVVLDRCGYALDQGPEFESFEPLVDALRGAATSVSLATVLGDLNRTPVVVAASAVPGNPPGVTYAFRWDASENTNLSWVPQGLSGSADAQPGGLVNGRRILLMSAYFDEDVNPNAPPKGVRLALVDITDPANPSYRFLLLVEPTPGPSWVPVPIHAGGIAWVGDYLYVADTSKGLRVFDFRQIFQADTSADVIGCDGLSCKAGLYKYALPQIGAYRRAGDCAPPRFSFVALDRDSDPPALVTGEYCSQTACTGALSGRALRFAIDPSSGLLAGGQRTYSTDAFFMGETQVQGAVSHGGRLLLSSSEPPAGAGALFTVDESGSTTYGWIDAPEDVMLDTQAEQIWSLSEGNGARYVFSANVSSYLP